MPNTTIKNQKDSTRALGASTASEPTPRPAEAIP